MAKAHVKKGDEVVVIAGSEKGRRGKILEVNTKKQRVLVEGLKMIKRHTKQNARTGQGGIIEREGTMHISNVMLAVRFDERAAKRPAAEKPAAAPIETVPPSPETAPAHTETAEAPTE
jgi:large subunit ribosomal protein L24